MTGSALFLLDTNTATYIMTGRSQEARTTMREVEPHARVAVSAITQAQILFGIEKKPEALRLRAAVEVFLRAIPILPWDARMANSAPP